MNNNHAPSRERISNAWILDVRFKIDYTTGVENCPTSPTEFKAFLESGGTEPWTKIEGLKSKFFTLSQDEQYGSGIYVFVSRETLDAYMNSELFKGFGGLPHITELNVTTYQVLAGSEETMDMEPWPSGNKKPSRADMESAVIFYPRFTIDYTTGAEGSPSNAEEFAGALIEPMNFAKMWHNSNVPGLRSKFFTIDETKTVGTGVYIFVDRKHLDNYLNSEILAGFKSLPHITDIKVDIYSVIGGSESTMDLMPW